MQQVQKDELTITVHSFTSFIGKMFLDKVDNVTRERDAVLRIS